MSKKNTNATDHCSTTYSADTIDPFEGLNLEDICVSPHDIEKASPEKDLGNELFGLNPLDGIDLEDLSVNPDTIASAHSSTNGPPQGSDNINFVITPDNKPTKEDKQQQAIKRPVRSLSKDTSHLPVKQKKAIIDPIIERAYHYAELTQIREKVFSSLEKSGGNTLLIASPHDNTGSSLLAAALGYNAACSCQKSVLLIDCNMRRAGLHNLFNIPQLYGFTELIKNNLPWQAVVKKTGVENLSVITAGEHCDNFSEYIRYSHIPELLNDIRNHYDLIIIDTSPVLAPNRNNVNIVSLTSEADYFLLITKQSGTTKDDLIEAKNVIEAGNGTIDGIVINEHTPDKKIAPYPN
ncbi:ATPase involved in chromosome partitioning [Desulfocapsa sulfexigens DSM 10523]|uniref:ATPase involved in chromosome partitioning n=1 Tax=Desulfocapsa sulfexigens (strain DSM 10523 / SB164P1) TaxID=1167006 RepID=M1PE84_DESSD|nr:CpsD/CapB family tyrosine-protein kinase [Desulfocapsa sulfexigens]AGF79892.1 ATPase involved in chromosome partitioning [Desulfocapsa sulfexigens DSM 10523]